LKLKSTNLLIVEDQLYIRDKIKEEALKTDVFDVAYVCETLKEALNIINTQEVHIITLDLSLPDGGGLEILSYIKNNNLNIKVLVFSASSEMKNISLRYGANYFFDKKNGLEPLISALSNCLSTP